LKPASSQITTAQLQCDLGELAILRFRIVVFFQKFQNMLLHEARVSNFDESRVPGPCMENEGDRKHALANMKL
jgi:hypothetical protein